VLLATGCIRWEDSILPKPTRAQGSVDITDRVVQVFSHGQKLEWRLVSVTGDSISGIPRDSSVKCVTCRAHLARVEVDSVRIRDFTPFTELAAAFVGFNVVFLVLYWELTSPPCHVKDSFPCT
jgi:hypothetical protein